MCVCVCVCVYIGIIYVCVYIDIYMCVFTLPQSGYFIPRLRKYPCLREKKFKNLHHTTPFHWTSYSRRGLCVFCSFKADHFVTSKIPNLTMILYW